MIDLEKGIYIQIEGELGKYNAIPIDKLVKIADSLQKLINKIASIDIPSEEFINKESFVIELTDFKKGSAVPAFRLSQRPNALSGPNVIEQRKAVSNKVQNLFEISDSGNYRQILSDYPEPAKRNEIVDDFYGFINSFGNSPTNIVTFDNGKPSSPLYSFKPFKSDMKNTLKAKIKEVKDEGIKENAVGEIEIITKAGKTRRNVKSVYKKENYSLQYAPSLIILPHIKYFMKFPFHCSFYKEEDYFVIEHEMTGIVGTGETEDDAELSFAEDFDVKYNWLKRISPDKLTLPNKKSLEYLDYIVEKIEE